MKFWVKGGHCFCMRRVQLALIEDPNFGTAYSFAESKSDLLGVIFWWTPRQVAVCAFLDIRSRVALWSCNSSLLVDSIEVQLSLSNLSKGCQQTSPLECRLRHWRLQKTPGPKRCRGEKV